MAKIGQNCSKFISIKNHSSDIICIFPIHKFLWIGKFLPFFTFSEEKYFRVTKTRAKILVFLTKKDKDFGCFFVKIYLNFDENIRLRCRQAPQARKIGNFAISIAKFEKNLSDD